MNQKRMSDQLSQLTQLIRFIDPGDAAAPPFSSLDLVEHLERCESSEMFFSFRWILIWLKREFPLQDLFSIWEVSFPLLCLISGTSHGVAVPRLRFVPLRLNLDIASNYAPRADL